MKNIRVKFFFIIYFIAVILNNFKKVSLPTVPHESTSSSPGCYQIVTIINIIILGNIPPTRSGAAWL